MRKLFPALVIVFLLAQGGIGTAQAVKTGLLPCKEAQGASSFDFSIEPEQFHVSPQGQVAAHLGDGAVRNFKLALDKGPPITRVFACDADPDLYLGVQTGEGHAATSWLFHLRKSDLRILWRQDLQAYGLTYPYFDENVLYISGFGSLNAINVKDGKFVWSYTNLSRHNQYGAFDPPTVDSTIVSFAETSKPGAPTGTTVKINKRTGKVMEPRELADLLNHNEKKQCPTEDVEMVVIDPYHCN